MQHLVDKSYLSRSRAQALLALVALVAAVAGTASLKSALAPALKYQPAYELNDEAREEVNSSAFALILGEARASMADLMWIKTERYLHRGVAFAPHIDADAMAHTGEVETKPAAAGHADADEDHDHEHEQPLIPTADRDYRGFVGTIQRAVQPWQDPSAPHAHGGGDELAPWYRLLTLSDPHHTRGYMIGAWWLSRMDQTDPRALEEASSFIEEGIRNNPDCFQLWLMRGRVQMRREQWTDAIASFGKASALALKSRPADGQLSPPVWTEDNEEDFASALRLLPMVRARHLGDPQGAIRDVRQALQYIPKDAPLNRLLADLESSAANLNDPWAAGPIPEGAASASAGR